MVCRHSPGDPNCSSSKNYRGDDYDRPNYSLYGSTPDASKYHIEDVARVGSHLVLKVKYPNCSRCSFEGVKVMVFLNVSEADALRWRQIDPHFRDPKLKSFTSAPSPAARFPATSEGWSDALAYAQGKR